MQCPTAPFVSNDVRRHRLSSSGYISQAGYKLDAVAAENEVARALKVKPGSPIFRIERTSYSTGSRPVDYETLHYRGDLTRFVTKAPETTCEGVDRSEAYCRDVGKRALKVCNLPDIRGRILSLTLLCLDGNAITPGVSAVCCLITTRAISQSACFAGVSITASS